MNEHMSTWKQNNQYNNIYVISIPFPVYRKITNKKLSILNRFLLYILFLYKNNRYSLIIILTKLKQRKK